MTTLRDMLSEIGVGLAEITAHLEDGTHAAELHQVLELSPMHQRRLWELAKGGAPLGLDYFVPDDARSLTPYPFEGCNTLPLMSRFKKVFYRTEEDTIGGRNEQSLSWLTGHGYYLVHPADRRPGELAIDYLVRPESRPSTWPDIRPNEDGLSRFVYGGMVDFVRRVSANTVIGRAYRQGRNPMKAWFVLCRQSPAS